VAEGGRYSWWRILALASGLAMLASGAADAERVSDVRSTKHNLSASGPGTVRATTESQVCVFCHTPHGATQGVTPLWNRQLSNQTYTPYTSFSLDAEAIQGTLDQPGGSSKLCLSCHDGTMAIGNVNVLNGVPNVTIAMQGTGAGGTMPPGSGVTTGFTRNLGVDLTNDHPISVNYTSALADRDGELRRVDAQQKWPVGTGTVIGVKVAGSKPLLPLEPTGAGNLGQVQCGTCHDPHLHETNPANGNQKFLRQNRFQDLPPTGAQYDAASDIICLACHDKNLGTGTWAFSAHANQLVANETYSAASATLREFPPNLPVWRASCMNCHDTHTVPGAKRLAREGTDSTATPKAGGNSAQEETCYQCHTTSALSAVTGSGTSVPNIRSDFLLARRMPITTLDQGGGTEVHEIGTGPAPGFSELGVDCSTTNATNRCGADFLEPRARLQSRHAECTDCHNPHRVIKSQNGIPGALNGAVTNAKAGTHRHEDAAGYTHTNIVSGVLRGAWGVEPVYSSTSFHDLPNANSFQVKRGDPGSSAATDVGSPYVTREYQICMKCHSNYGYPDDNNTYPNTPTRPQLGGPGLTPVSRPSDLRNHTTYTNQAKEFQAPLTHQGTVNSRGTEAGAAPAYNNNNHRSWHPVMNTTGRTAAARGGNTGPWRTPWSNAVGTQTMYCSDCHGTDTGATTVMPNGNTNTNEDGNPWGPHGSANNFILKGTWNQLSGTGQANTLCFKCHNPANYADRNGAGTGFNTDRGDGHGIHADRIGNRVLRCSWCHVAVPHGWKNMALLVNLNDVGLEVGLPAGTQVRNNTTAAYNNGPYYMNAMNKVRNFRSSGQWVETDCGSAGAPGNGQSGRDWMRDSNENCANPP